MSDLWDAYVGGNYQAIPEADLRRLDAAERMVTERFGIGTQYYVRANEVAGRSVKLADVAAALVLDAPPADDLATAEVTLATLRQWAERNTQAGDVAARGSVAAGYEHAARDALAILDSRYLPEGEPVIFGND